jgi:5'(3')-deoxyribonucleotidase
MIKTVYLDVDGVMVDFLGGLHKALDAPYSYNPYPYKKGLWNMLDAIRPSNFNGNAPSFEECNACCTQEFWANLDWIHDGHDILRLIVDTFGKNNIWLLTTLMPNVGSASGKIEWINKCLPWYSKRIFITTASKSVVASPDALLIDDRDKNVEDFCTAGGHAILVARPWNKLHMLANDTIESLKYSIDQLRSIGVIQW